MWFLKREGKPAVDHSLNQTPWTIGIVDFFLKLSIVTHRRGTFVTGGEQIGWAALSE